jgi:glycosyltransferase involved in cell wall biosynthesis
MADDRRNGTGRAAARSIARLSRTMLLRLGGRRLHANCVNLLNKRSLAASGLFDRTWYLQQNPDVRAAGVNPLSHYLRYGAAEGRDPNPLFDTDWYVGRYLDVGASGINPLVHYLRYGAAEGRDPSPVFDSDWYLERYPDVRAAGVNPLGHYLRHGAAEGRAPRAGPFGRPSGLSAGGGEGRDIVVLDDMFPQSLSQFRFEEFVSYLDLLPNLRVCTDGRMLPLLGETRTIEEVIADHIRDYPRHSGRVSPLSNDALPDGAIAYTIFADNIHFYLGQIEQRRMPFAFTLYPGGGFRPHQEDSDERLRRVFGSPWFRRVIATQPLSRDYLVERKLCPPERITYILGGVIARSAFQAPDVKLRFGSAKKCVDICFVAGRYTPTGTDKGYDLFVDTANALCAAGVDARFHVVGNFDAGIIDLGSAASRFRFYGLRPREFFREFYRHMDLILAPTRPSTRSPGAFDGFPTAACVEAGLQEVAVVCSDELRLNRGFEDGSDMVIIRPSVAGIMDRLMQLVGEPERIAAIGERGRKRMTELFDREVQIKPRVDMLRSLGNE